MRLADQDARDRIGRDFGTTLVVEAASGTGKTTELVTRMVEMLAGGHAQLAGMVALTFTDAASGELKLRLRAAIEQTRQDAATPEIDRGRLTRSLQQLEEARIGTIHSFCADLLRERPVEAGVDPLFEVAPEDVARPLFDRAFDRWFEAQLEAPGEAVRRVLRRRTREEGPRGILRAAAWELMQRRDFPTPWRRDGGFDRDGTIDAILEEMAALGKEAAAGDAEDYFTRSLETIGRFANEVARREMARGRDYDGLEAELGPFSRQRFWNWSGYRSGPPGFPKAELRARRDALHQRLETFLTAAGADLAPQLRDELWPVVVDYEHLKKRAGCLDFIDLLLLARDLVRNDATVRTDLQQRFTHVLVDEFQDTDPLQAEILLLLAADDPDERDWRRVRPVPGKLFVVGDPKQSIYRFRRADVALYEAIKRQLLAAGGALVELTVSFRAVPEIQETVNAAFAPRMRGDTPSEPRYVPLAPYRAGVATQPAVIALPAPAPYGDFRTIVKWRIESSLPDAVAAFVDWLVRESGWTVTERTPRPGEPDARVAIRERHVCLLFRRFKSFGEDVTRPYVRALEARHLRHLLVGGSSFHLREEVEAIRNALGAIERPEDELAVFATLRGPLFAVSDAALLAYRTHCRTLHPFRPMPEDLPAELAHVTEALGVLRDLHRGRNRRPIADTIGTLLAKTRAPAALAIWPTGEQALANTSRLMDLARRAERHGVRSFRSFVDWLVDQEEHGEASDAPIVEEGTEGIRIMTVHRAKGLEFPVVVLCDVTANETPAQPMRWVDAEHGLCAMKLAGSLPPELVEHQDDELAREREEAARVLYVAATRARDLLVVSAVGEAAQDGWLSALNPAVYPPPSRCREPATRQPAGCGAFGLETIAVRPSGVQRPEAAVTPGAHRPAVGGHTVVWWDPNVLGLNVQESVGLSQQKLLAVDESGERSQEGIAAHDAWQAERKRLRAEAQIPTLRIVTATEHAAAADGAPAEVDVESVGASPRRPHGRRFGSLVHGVLASVDLDADRAGVAAVAELQSRLLGATAEEVEAAVEAVVSALAHPVLRRAATAARAGRCRRETPVAVELEDGTLVEGVVDAAFLEDERWTVLDFKTDVELSGRLDEYRRQVGLYVSAVARATGRAARGVLLRV